MKPAICLFVFITAFIACQQPVKETAATTLPLQGTWKLVTGILIEKGDSAVTDYTTGKSFIKVLNQSHFAFVGHDLGRGKDSTAFYTSGAGTYNLQDSNYTEHLEFCNDRGWEGNDFHFTITIHNDTLVQQGIEKIDSLGIDRINIEKYVRVKQG
ncbi:lipocalin-like domain-containing protein [Panacibacter sp. DH6]|uniref:Lipocalin-like domain-containing protein n=1 Tax=Panacibacter microcysteis TaxID=2793269 RepID=A0A931E885_9BACT|nr:lipocalin-like domain-containing protein [Panacibacter microcysteis]MBG9376913.1 lipocalin-like domain-containing protein [Panacibacter microcysteis]